MINSLLMSLGACVQRMCAAHVCSALIDCLHAELQHEHDSQWPAYYTLHISTAVKTCNIKPGYTISQYMFKRYTLKATESTNNCSVSIVNKM